MADAAERLPDGGDDGGELVFPGKQAGAIGTNLNAHAEGVGREEAFDVLRPFHEAEMSGVEIVVEADVEGFGRVLNAIEIKVVDRRAVRGPVFVNDGKGGGGNGILAHPQAGADGRNEGGLAGSHRGIERYEFAAADGFQEVVGGSWEGREVRDGYLLSHAAGKDRKKSLFHAVQTVQETVSGGFAQMTWFYVTESLEVGNGSGHLDNTGEGTGGESHTPYDFFQ